jgi:peptidoglycan/xylan/chitin deacetylase (PgdA/CDA1 family)
MPVKFFTEIVEFISALAYALFLPLIRKGCNRTVVYYHSVRKKDARQFEKQIAYLARKYKVIKPSEIRTAPGEGPKALVAITFDDAFISVLENAIPILKKYGLTAGIFVPAGNMGQSPRWEMSENCIDKNETVMSQSQIAKLSDDGFEILSHTMSHPILTQIDENRLRHELLESKKKLAEIIQCEVSGISYPNGVYDATVCNAARRAGYRFAFTIVPEMVDCSPDDMRIGRFTVSAKDSMLKFRLKVSGAYQITKYLQGLKKCVCKGWGW